MSRPVTLLEPGTVKLERLLPGPIERVWAYITESDKRAKWLAAGEFDLRLGGRIELRFDNNRLSADKNTPERHKGGHEPMVGVITRLEPPRLLAHTWMWRSGETEVTYELAERGAPAVLGDAREAGAGVRGGAVDLGQIGQIGATPISQRCSPMRNAA